MVKLRLRDIFKQDLDELFAYSTPVTVSVKLRWLGLLKILLSVMILLYFVVYALILEKVYLSREYTEGTALLFSSGTALSLNDDVLRIWDSVDLVYPAQDSGATIIATQIIETPKQSQGTCIDTSRPCESSDECLLDGQCTSGFCEEIGYCSSEEPITYDLEGVENFLVWFQASVDFTTIGMTERSTLDEDEVIIYPDSGSNVFVLRDLLILGGVNFIDIKQSGAILKVNVKWQCDFTWTDDCSYNLDVSREDGNSGFRYKRYVYYKENDVLYRDLQDTSGIRILLQATGEAKALTIAGIILQVGAFFSLLTIVPVIVDFVMLYLLKECMVIRDWKFLDDPEFPRRRDTSEYEEDNIELP